MGDEWARMNLDWFQAFGPEDKLVIFYSDLVKDTVAVLRRILDFLQVSVSGTTLQCVLERKEGIYKRSKKKLGFEVFTNGMKAFLQEKQKSVYQVLQKTNSSTLQLLHWCQIMTTTYGKIHSEKQPLWC